MHWRKVLLWTLSAAILTAPVYVTPDFEEKRLAADFFVKGRIRVIYFLRLFLRLYQDKELKRMWKQIHRLKKEAF